jgi:hypothetical protein
MHPHRLHQIGGSISEWQDASGKEDVEERRTPLPGIIIMRIFIKTIWIRRN